MMNKMKQYLTHIFGAGIGLLNFILLAIPYVSYGVEYESSYMSAYNFSEGVNGYDVSDLWSFGFGGVMSSLTQILIIVLGLTLLAWGIVGLLKAFGLVEKLPDSLEKIENKKWGAIGLIGVAGLNVLLLVFLIIFVAANSESAQGVESGFSLSAGIFVAIVFTVGAFVALKLLEKKFPASENGETITYVCAKCGKKAREKDKFCNICGGEIEKKVIVKEEYACAKCGKNATAKDKFCNVCGGEIKMKETPAPVKEEAATIDDVVPQG